MSKAKAKIDGKEIILPLNVSQGSIRIADEYGNHFPSPTKVAFQKENYIEWMITNSEIKSLTKVFSDTEVKETINELKNIKNFVDESKYSKRETKNNQEEIDEFHGFKVYQYADIFNSFEKILSTNLKVRLTFKLGDFGTKPHPHMYVLIPFSFNNLDVENIEGSVNEGDLLGSKAKAKVSLNNEEISEIIITLAHASQDHCNDLIEELSN